MINPEKGFLQNKICTMAEDFSVSMLTMCHHETTKKTFGQTKLNIRRYFDDDKNSLKMRTVSRACPHTRGDLLSPIQTETN